MHLEHYPIEKLKKEILEIMSAHLDLRHYRVFFFGSRVTGAGTDRSDIDVGIQGSAPIPAKAWIEVQDAFENFPTLYKIDIVDFGRVAAIFCDVALRHTEDIMIPV